MSRISNDSRKIRNRRETAGRTSRRRPLSLESLEDRRLLASVELLSAAHPDLSYPSPAGDSYVAPGAISEDGRYVAFVSSALNLVSGMTVEPGTTNVYRYDRSTDEVLLVSVNSDGDGGGNGTSEAPAISADGSVIAFRSQAADLHPLDTDSEWDIFVRDLDLGETHLASINRDNDAGGDGNSTGGPVISADGSMVAFESGARNLHELSFSGTNVFARDWRNEVTHLVSINAAGTGGGNSASGEPSISADGTLVAFVSHGTDLHPLDTDDEADVFLRDLTNGTTHLISVNSDGDGSGNQSSASPTISADGSVVAFVSNATNLHPDDADWIQDVYARDWSAGTTHLVSVDRDGSGGGSRASYDPAISADGSVVAFWSYADNLHEFETDSYSNVFARDLNTGTTHLVSVDVDGTRSGDSASYQASVSADGTRIAFYTSASNLHALPRGDGLQVMVRDLASGTTQLASLNVDSSRGGNAISHSPAISADGSAVAFTSEASDLVFEHWDGYRDVFVRGLDDDITQHVSRAASASWSSASAGGKSELSRGAVSADGRYVVFVSDAPNLVNGLDLAPGVWNVYRFDRGTGEMSLASINADGTGSGNADSKAPSISADGRFVAFASLASDLHDLDDNMHQDIFVRDLQLGITHLASVNQDEAGSGSGPSYDPAISADGSRVAFFSQARNLHELDEDGSGDVFVRDLIQGETYLVSVNSAGDGSGNGWSYQPSISGDGTVVAFQSGANNLHGTAASAGGNVFARDLTNGVTYLVSVNTDGTGGANEDIDELVLSASGTVVAFTSRATNLHELATSGQMNVFVRELGSDTTHLASISADGDAEGDAESYDPVISADGTVVSFDSCAGNLHRLDTNGYRNVFARDLNQEITHLVSVNRFGTAGGNGYSYDSSINADGTVVSFRSDANDLDVRDGEYNVDLFVRNLAKKTTQLASLRLGGDGGGESLVERHAISADGAVVAFSSRASDLTVDDFNGYPDVFALALGEAPPTLQGLVDASNPGEMFELDVASADDLEDLLEELTHVTADHIGSGEDPITIRFQLAAGSYRGSLVEAAPGLVLVMDAGERAVEFSDDWPALTVGRGQVELRGATLSGLGSAPTVLVESGGSLKLSGTTVHEADGWNQSAILVQSDGTLDLTAANNRLDVQGDGKLIVWQDAGQLNIIGNTFTRDGAALTNGFEIEDAVTHAVDQSESGRVTWSAGKVYVTPASGSIQRGIDAAAHGDTVHIAAGTYVGDVSTSPGRNLTVAAGASPGRVTVDGDLTLAGGDTLEIEIDGTQPGDEFDQWVVTGNAALGGATLRVVGSYAPSPAAPLALSIVTSGAGPVGGQFANLPEGAAVMLNGKPLTVTYQGNEGNDVLLSYEPPDRDGEGNVTAVVKKGDLIITGDNFANAVEIRRVGTSGTWQITGIGETKVNNATGPTMVTGATRDVLVRMQVGDDYVRIDDSTVPRDLRIEMGNGTTLAVLDQVTVNRNAAINNGAGPLNELLATDCHVKGDISVRGGNGSDRAYIFGTLVGRDLTAALGSGADLLALGESRVIRDAKVNLGGGGLNAPRHDQYLGTEIRGETLGIRNSVVGRSVNVQTSTKAGHEAMIWIGSDAEAAGQDALDDDVLTTIAQDLTLRGGAGKEWIGVQTAAVNRDLKIEPATGDDEIDLWDVDIRRNAQIKLNNGSNVVRINEVSAGGRFTLAGGRGQDQVLVGTWSDWGLHSPSAKFTLGAGNDLAVLHNSEFQQLQVNTSSGNNQLHVRGNTVTVQAKLQGGRGNDGITRDFLDKNDLTKPSAAKFKYFLDDWFEAD